MGFTQTVANILKQTPFYERKNKIYPFLICANRTSRSSSARSHFLLLNRLLQKLLVWFHWGHLRWSSARRTWTITAWKQFRAARECAAAVCRLGSVRLGSARPRYKHLGTNTQTRPTATSHQQDRAGKLLSRKLLLSRRWNAVTWLSGHEAEATEIQVPTNHFISFWHE